MKDIEEQILSYPHLSAEKQREVEAYVEARPEWTSLLRDVRTIESLVRGVDGKRSESLLTTYVVMQHLHPGDVPSELAESFARLEQELEENPELRERAEAARQRLKNAEATVDPAAQFESLTGHALESDTAETPAAETTSTRDAIPNRDAAAPLQAFVDELLRLPLAMRWAGAAVALLLGTYTVLFTASEVSQSPLDRLAAVDVSNQVVSNYTSTTTRSAAPSPDTLTADQLYVDALTAVKDARTSTLGLFPSYDDAELDRADRLLNQVLDRTESGSFLALEVRYYLGKVNLAQEQVEAARSHFRAVVEREGRMAEKARDILDTLQKEYSADEQNTGS